MTLIHYHCAMMLSEMYESESEHACVHTQTFIQVRNMRTTLPCLNLTAIYR